MPMSQDTAPCDPAKSGTTHTYLIPKEVSEFLRISLAGAYRLGRPIMAHPGRRARPLAARPHSAQPGPLIADQ